MTPRIYKTVLGLVALVLMLTSNVANAGQTNLLSRLKIAVCESGLSVNQRAQFNKLRNDLSGERLVAMLKSESQILAQAFESQNTTGESLEEHTIAVMNTGDSYLDALNGYGAARLFSENLYVYSLVRLAYALHDIGKPATIAAHGNSARQKEYTEQLIQQFLQEQHATPEETAFILSLATESAVSKVYGFRNGFDFQAQLERYESIVAAVPAIHPTLHLFAKFALFVSDAAYYEDVASASFIKVKDRSNGKMLWKIRGYDQAAQLAQVLYKFSPSREVHGNHEPLELGFRHNIQKDGAWAGSIIRSFFDLADGPLPGTGKRNPLFHSGAYSDPYNYRIQHGDHDEEYIGPREWSVEPENGYMPAPKPEYLWNEAVQVRWSMRNQQPAHRAVFPKAVGLELASVGGPNGYIAALGKVGLTRRVGVDARGAAALNSVEIGSALDALVGRDDSAKDTIIVILGDDLSRISAVVEVARSRGIATFAMFPVELLNPERGTEKAPVQVPVTDVYRIENQSSMDVLQADFLALTTERF